MQFGIPEDNIIQSPRAIATNPLRAKGSLNYSEFIALVKKLWESVYPDIPIKPVQSETYAATPVIVYSLENRKTHNTEPKQRYREEIVTEGDNNYIINGQRFQNYIAFSAIDHSPDLSEDIIETFEDFMLEHTPIFKKLGLSDIFYSRRLSDREETRAGSDVCIRTVVYMCVIERVTRTSVAKLQEILTNVSISTRSLSNYAWVSNRVVPVRDAEGNLVKGSDGEYETETLLEGDWIENLSNRPLNVGDSIRAISPTNDDIAFQGGSDAVEIPQSVGRIIGTEAIVDQPESPGGIIPGGIYEVTETHHQYDSNYFRLKQLAPSIINHVNITDYGWFRYVFIEYRKDGFTIDLDDSTDLPSATPSS